MNPTEARAAFDALRDSISGVAEVHVNLQNYRFRTDGPALSCSIYPDGMSRGRCFSVEADDFAALAQAAQAKWDEHCDVHRQRTIRKMALEIIQITAEFGECTDAALRGTTFTADEVARYGADACADATAIAANGPFSIVTHGGANGAPAEDEEAA